MRFMSLHLLIIPLLLPLYFAEQAASDSASLALGASQCPNDSLRSAQLKRPKAKKNGQVTLKFSPTFETDFGEMYEGDALNVMRGLIAKGRRAKLIMTSPPFALLRKKAYGNEDADHYINWFMKFSDLYKEILEPDGSLVIDIGGSWLRGLPVRSTYHFELLLRLCRSGFYLAQEFYHYNPSRLPTPAEWVTIRRLRVKDAVNTVWWLVRDPFTHVNNRRVLRPYSDRALVHGSSLSASDRRGPGYRDGRRRMIST